MRRTVVAELDHEGRQYLVIGYAVPRPAILAELTPAELDVVDRYIEGASIQAIALARKARPRTVVNQLASIYRKLGIGSRNELARMIHGQGRCE